MQYFATHAGKAILAVTGAALILAVPIVLPWVVAVLLLQVGVRHLKLAFREVDRDLSLRADDTPNGTPLPEAHNGQRVLAGAGRDLVRTRPQV